MNSILNSRNESIEDKKIDKEIDLTLIIKFLLRNKKLISLFSLFFLIFGYFYSFLPKRIWEGQFQIVLSSGEEQNNQYSPSPFFKSFMLKNNSGNNLQTEVEILKSPSVLTPVYEMVIAQMENLPKNYTFSAWKETNLKIDLQEETSILNISS